MHFLFLVSNTYVEIFIFELVLQWRTMLESRVLLVYHVLYTVKKNILFFSQYWQNIVVFFMGFPMGHVLVTNSLGLPRYGSLS